MARLSYVLVIACTFSFIGGTTYAAVESDLSSNVNSNFNSGSQTQASDLVAMEGDSFVSDSTSQQPEPKRKARQLYTGFPYGGYGGYGSYGGYGGGLGYGGYLGYNPYYYPRYNRYGIGYGYGGYPRYPYSYGYYG